VYDCVSELKEKLSRLRV